MKSDEKEFERGSHRKKKRRETEGLKLYRWITLQRNTREGEERVKGVEEEY